MQQHRSVTALMDRLGRCFEELNFDPHRFEKIIEVTSTDDLFEDQVCVSCGRGMALALSQPRARAETETLCN